MSPRAERHPRTVSEGDSSEAGPQRVLADAAKPTGRRVVYDPAVHCGGKTRKSRPCVQVMGYKTAHVGLGSCRYHGGNSPNGRKHAATEGAKAALASLGVPVETDPQHALLEQVWEAAGNVAFLRAQVIGFGADLTLHSEDRTRSRSDGDRDVIITTIREDVRAVVKLYGEERDRLAKIAKMALDAGIAAAFVAIAKSQAEAIAAVVEAVLAGLDLDEAQRERGREIGSARLRLLAGGKAA